MVAGHCIVPFDLWSFGLGGLPATMLLGCWPLPCPFGTLPAQVESLGQGSLPAASLPQTLLLRRSCGRPHSKSWLPGFRLFCKSFLRGTLSSSDQASVPSDALVEPRLDFLLLCRRRTLVSGLSGCSVLCFRCESNAKSVTNPSYERRSRQ